MSKNKIIINNALLIFGGIVGFFFLMKILGLNNVSELRLLNFVFVLWGINKAIKTNIKLNQESLYFSNFSIGVGTSILAVGLTILGLIIYVGFIDPELITVLGNSSFWGKNLNLSLIVFALAIEGIASSVICSFILMQYYKNYKITNTSIA
ncbi:MULTISPECIES: hypothetical protein [Tenacibaculum]|uniref:hypothetical protein n=1 Tax=Tenacibaculum TaxID=104267 RepID=UPI00089A21E1|nr:MULTISPECIES: hypothetical protein [unclassified Tenacibaculum]RBW58189.1 hypothetical protein DS884_10010 [Tenacibaculum sp. E3R01]SED55930.1 hypothetical protein SAMN04487765_0355 [Tenacibaculum sp. MAR_2010_89]